VELLLTAVRPFGRKIMINTKGKTMGEPIGEPMGKTCGKTTSKMTKQACQSR
jgi:hypothetical protein